MTTPPVSRHPIEERLGYEFRNHDLLDTALTHRSFSATRGARNNEKLEFLGDAVLELAVSDLLMKHSPQHHEGELSKLRASLVNARILAEKAAALGLGDLLKLGKGEEKSGGRSKESILAAGFEALVGAIYLDRGFVAARRILARQFSADIRSRSPSAVEDCKTRLQEITQKLFKATPTYTLVMETGPDHAKHFVSQISVGSRTFGRGEGRSKKSAEQAAAMEALEALRVEAQTVVPRRAHVSETGGRAADDGSGTSRAATSSGTRGQR
jgi:ribonuclease-3